MLSGKVVSVSKETRRGETCRKTAPADGPDAKAYRRAYVVRPVGPTESYSGAYRRAT